MALGRLSDTTSKGVITAMKSIFVRHGIPDIVISDNGPQYASEEFRSFPESWEFTHVTSSPGHAQSNGQAERTVQTVKQLLKRSQNDAGDPYIALVEYRNTPLESVGLSPAQMLMGRRLKTKLPESTSLLTPERALNVHKQLKAKQAKQKKYYDQHAKPLPELHKGENVRMHFGDKWKPAVVLEKHIQPRSYVVSTSESRMLRRNRRHLRQTAESMFPPTAAESNVDVDMNCEKTPSVDKVKSHTQSLAATLSSHSCNPSTLAQPYRTRSGRLVKAPLRYNV
uniref:Integrase catalytic domain-containing protein n=1 Tax=Acanthochromis polyacanthus TaxID=80966 RepID=A0A3Q1F5U6_9TELE